LINCQKGGFGGFVDDDAVKDVVWAVAEMDELVLLHVCHSNFERVSFLKGLEHSRIRHEVVSVVSGSSPAGLQLR